MAFVVFFGFKPLSQRTEGTIFYSYIGPSGIPFCDKNGIIFITHYFTFHGM